MPTCVPFQQQESAKFSQLILSNDFIGKKTQNLGGLSVEEGNKDKVLEDAKVDTGK